MPTPRKPWPHASEWARLDCIVLAEATVRILLDVMDKSDDPATLRRLMKAIEQQHKIINDLKECKHVSKSS